MDNDPTKLLGYYILELNSINKLIDIRRLEMETCEFKYLDKVEKEYQSLRLLSQMMFYQKCALSSTIEREDCETIVNQCIGDHFE